MIDEAVRAERQALNRLDAARKVSDRRAVLQAARAIKPPFAKLYMSFGDFTGGTPVSSDSNGSGATGAATLSTVLIVKLTGLTNSLAR